MGQARGARTKVRGYIGRESLSGVRLAGTGGVLRFAMKFVELLTAGGFFIRNVELRADAPSGGFPVCGQRAEGIFLTWSGSF